MNATLFLRLAGLIICFLLMTTPVQAQESSVEFWPEADIWYRLNNSWRFSAFMPITKYHESANRDFNIYLQADYAFGHTRTPFFNRRIDENKEQKLKGYTKHLYALNLILHLFFERHPEKIQE